MAGVTDYTTLGLLPDMFKAQATRTPENVAVVTNTGSLTYAELDDVTDKLASFLRLNGVVPDSCVGIYMEKCLEYVISYIAILKAGGAYLPLDVAYPSRLVHDILSDATPRYILSKKDYISNMETMQESTLDMTGDWIAQVSKNLSSAKSIPEAQPMTLDNLAYVVYSSGTTGKPKGIQCPHRGAVFSYTWRHDTYPYGEDEREACNIFFVWELFRPLCKGVTLYVVPDNVIYDPPQLCHYIRDNKITRQLFTPSLFETIIEYNLPNVKDCLASLRQVWFCGEVVTTSLLERSVKMFPWIQYINLYSISESHDIAHSDLSEYYKLKQDTLTSRKFCPVGKVLPGGVKVYIMGEDLGVKPVGVAGEIYVGGPTLARGYLNRPDLNRDRFIPAPSALKLGDGQKLYKAGDWGYLLSDGSLEICGRCDSMHKVRGYSIEVQAIEAAMLDLPMVNSCVILVEGAEGDDKFLVSYVVPEGQTTKREIREALKKRLPFYMIPSYFIFLTSIPVLASSGKLDKKALPKYDSQDATNSSSFEDAAITETEKKLLPYWRELLGAKHIDVQESFFDLGGHSLLAAKLLSKVYNEFEVQLTVQDLFRHSCITSLGKLIDCKKEGNSLSDEIGLPEVDLNNEVDKHDQATLINRPLAHVHSLAVETSMDMQLRAFWRMFNYRPNWRTGSVLLTGSTGFLGAFIIKDLIASTQAHIHCVVRTGSDDAPINRVLDNLRKYGIIDDKLTEDMVKDRVSCLAGDISLLRMGLSQEDYGYLLTEIDFIIHAAAYVNLLYPYHALHAANVMGTENIIVFACTGKIKPIHYISTDAVFPHDIDVGKETSDMTQYAGKLSDGYSQTKWVAEQLVLKAAQRGLPVAVYRCGNISGDRFSAAWNNQDFILSVLQACAKLQCAPDIDWELEFTPVDFISQVIVHLTQNVSLSFGKIFHLIQPKRLHIRYLAQWMNANGYRVKLVPPEDWINALSSPAGREITVISRLVGTPYLTPELLQTKRKFKSTNLLCVLPELELQYPSITSELLDSYFRGLRKAKLIPDTNTMSYDGKPLRGCIAVVTGSSSGIGAAIATHLASAGAKVALGARRQDRLQELKAKLEGQGHNVRYTVCDVTKADQVKKLVAETESEFGPVDVLVNNAGIMYYTDMVSRHEDEWEKQIDINCKGVVNGVGAVIDSMTSRKSGHIINMSSDAGRRGFAGLAVYSGTKFFVEGFSQALRHEMVPYGVKVTCIQPGDVKTELLTHTTDMQAKDKYDGSSQTMILSPDDIARAIVYVASQPKNVAINELLVEPAGAPI